MSTRVERESERSEKEEIMAKTHDKQRDKSVPEKKDPTAKIKPRRNQI